MKKWLLSALVFYRTTFTQAGKNLQGNYFWSGSVIREVNHLLDIGFSVGMSGQGSYAK